MKKVCFISRSAYPLFDRGCTATFGGAEVDLYLISTELAKDGDYLVSFIVGDFGQPKITKYNNVEIYSSYKADENKLIQIIKLILVIIRVKSDVYFQEGASGGTGVISFVCKILKRKFIYRTASDIDCNGRFIEENRIEGLLYLWGIRNAVKVITQNQNNASELVNTHGVSSVVIKNASVISNHMFNHKKNIILWVGRSESLKQPEIFFRIAQQLPQHQFVMIAPQANYNNVDVQALFQRYHLNNFEYLKRVPFDVIDDFFERAEVLINTSQYEGFPNTFVQAAKSSTAIFSLSVDPDGFIKSTNSGFVANGDENLLIQTLKNVLNDRKKLSDMQSNAFRYAKNEHNLNTIIPVYKELIRTI